MVIIHHTVCIFCIAEEDIAVLIDIQKQLEEDKPLRQWQTDWPSNQIPLPGNVTESHLYA